MARILVFMAASLALGAAGMWASSHVKVRLTSDDAPAALPLAPPVTEPARLPASVTATIRDASVVQAAAEAQTKTAPDEIISLTDVTLIWDGATLNSEIKLTGDKVVLAYKATGLKLNQLKVSGKGEADFKSVADDTQKGQLSITLTDNVAPPGTPVTFTIGRIDPLKPETIFTSSVTIRRPLKAEPAPFLITQKVNTVGAEFALVSTGVEVIGTYLRLKGRSSGGVLSGVTFSLLPTDNKPGAAVAVKSFTTANGDWECELTFPERRDGNTPTLLARGDFNGSHSYDPLRLAITFTALPISLAAPTLTVAKPNAPSVSLAPTSDSRLQVGGLPTYLSNVRGITVSVPAVAGARAVSLTLDAAAPDVKAAAALTVPTAPTVFAIPDVGAGRDHTFTATVAADGLVSTAAQIAVRVMTVGPSVESVSAPGFGQSNGVGGERVAIRFSQANPLEPGTLAGKFAVVQRTTTNGVGNDLVGGTLPDFDPVTNTVTLSVSSVIPGSYFVRVAPGVTDVYGNNLVPAPGSTMTVVYETTLYTQSVAPLPGVSAGVTLQTGPNVEFPEYTKFRRLEDGFNPSDRVETRVIRLYYNRDAHRVAQVVNRDVKSYNAATVDVRRRAADRSRDDANKLTDDRKQQEAVSVQAAKDSRAAEAALKDLQARQAAARTQSATATTQLGQRQFQLEDSLRNLGRERTNIGVRRANDPAADAANRRVADLSAEITQLKGALSLAGFAPDATLPKADADAVVARQSAADAQTAITVATATLKAEVDKVPSVQNAVIAQRAAEEKLKAPGLTAAAVEQLQVEAARARQDTEFAAQSARAAAASRPAFDTARKNFRDTQLKLVEVERARVAVATLAAKTRELADATTDAQRVATLAAASGANDPGADPSQDLAARLRTEITTLNSAAARAAADDQTLQSQVSAAQGDVQAKRGREEQFRREVAAAREDPDTYAPGIPGSLDPVSQCSISVIGEGLIQIRGPIKGLNVVRTMINQMDMPVGQVRVGVHTIQVNGERAERMDRVVQNIQRYLDHSRFLTTQSAQMLRKAVTTVAARKADEVAATLLPGCSQADRDQKYLHCFFGKDFIDELALMDSEFLKTGNKILSLHSMDSTSLSSALFLMSLAKNSIRVEIMAEFQCQLRTKLPQSEWNFYAAGLTCPTRCEAHCDRKFCVLAGNAKFESFQGYFNAEVQGDDTLNPLQREFIRLAQIFKSRLITEMELKQRVMERSILEDRVGDYLGQLREAKVREDAADKQQFELQKQVSMATAQAMQAVAQLEAAVQSVLTYQTSFEKELPELDKLKSIRVEEFIAPANRSTARRQDKEDTTPPVVQIDKLGRSGDIDLRESSSTKTYLSNVGGFLDQFVYFSNDSAEKYKRVKDAISLANSSDPAEQFSTKDKYTQLRDDLKYLLSLIHAEGTAASRTLKELTVALRSPNPNLFEIVGTYRNLQADYLAKLNTSGNAGDFKSLITAAFASGERAFADLGTAAAASQAATQNAKLARRRLDEKKLLDMLVDDLEDKFIELVDGTRAHTANVDNYLKGLATALDDDFNTQFYQPAFSKIRSLAVGWDVQLGQIESTTVLTNNRTLAKVSPAASMEFDLPQRSIFVKEAFKGAKAAMDDYGALLNDPTFLSTAKLFAGVPPSAGFGGQLGLPAVKNVLPGLPSSADELIMAQAGGKPKEFGSALEALIPDPAVYKFETGTGYEIRPVVNPDGQAVVFGFDYMYTSDVREPVRADEKHLGKVKRHFVHTDVQLSNFEMREVSKYWVALKASRTSQGVQLLQDIPGVGALFRPAPSAQSSLQQNLIYSQATIFPTLFDLMGLRYAPAVADVDAQFMKTEEFVVRGRREFLKAHIFGYGASRVDDALRILYGERRPDLYRTQQTIPWVHPNGYQGPGLRQRDSQLQEGYEPTAAYPPSRYAPGRTPGTTGAPADGGFGPPPGVMPYPPGAVVPTPGVDYQSFPPFTGATIPPPAGVPGAPAVTAARPAVPIEKTAQPLGTTVTPGLPPTPVRPGAPTVSAPPRPVAAFPSPSRP